MTSKWYVGIADAHGLESFFSDEEDVPIIAFLPVRAKLNQHRHAVFYRVKLADTTAQKIKSLIEQGDWLEALNVLKTNAEEIELPHDSPASWELIPNPALDPCDAYAQKYAPERN